MKIVLISGYAGSGKDTLSLYLQRELLLENKNVYMRAFATRVKECAYKEFMWDGNKDKKGRRLLQDIGMAGREYDENLWVKYVLMEFAGWYLPDHLNDFIIISDWRFPNEYEYCQKLFLETIRVRIVSNRVDPLEVMYLHVSEHSLPSDPMYYDYTIHNDKDLIALQVEAKELAQRLIKENG